MRTKNQLRCFIVGEGLLARQCAEALVRDGHQLFGIITGDAPLAKWAQDHEILTAPLTAEPPDLIRGHDFDYLLSIVNYQKLSPAWLKLPQKAAINFHNSLLPRHAGFNSTVWAIFHGESEHGITWHLMTEEVDAGAILKQVSVRVLPGMSSFQLNAECHEAGLTSFQELLQDLVTGRLQVQPQPDVEKSFHGRWQRPTPGCVIDWSWPAHKIDAMCRALDFGAAVNPLACPKVKVGDAYFVVNELRTTTTPSTQAPGKIVQADELSAWVTSADFDVEIRGLSTLEGKPVSRVAWSDFVQLAQAHGLEGPSVEEAHRIQEEEKKITRSERAWARRLLELKPLELPHATRTLSTQGEPDSVAVACPSAFVSSSSREEKSEMFLAAVAAYLARVSGARSFDLGWREEGTFPGLALFSQQLPFRVEVDHSQSFSDLVAHIRETRRQQLQQGTFARDLVQRFPELKNRPELLEELSFPISVAMGGQKNPTPLGQTLTFFHPENGAECQVIFNASQLPRAMADEVARQFEVLMRVALDEPFRLISELPLMDEAFEERVVQKWNETDLMVSGPITIAEAFSAQAQRTPESVALVHQEVSWTYRELQQRAEAIRQDLQRLGVGRGMLIGLCTQRNQEMVASLLAVQAVGAAYVPLDPEYPEERLRFMVQDAQLSLVIVDAANASLFNGIPLVRYRVDGSEPNGHSALAPAAKNGHSDSKDPLAYVMYTSGSTGKPKGVMITQKNVLNFFAGMDQRIGDQEPGVWLAVTSISFDISVLEIFWTLCRGYKVILSEGLSGLAETTHSPVTSGRKINLSLFYFASDAGGQETEKYRLLLEGAKFADRNGFEAVWTPERHFHAFGGLYPNPAVTCAALATITQRVSLRAGSVVAPLHHSLRLAEEWSMIDNLSRGRVGLSFASGWHEQDFVFAPDHYQKRRELLFEQIRQVRALWKGESIAFPTTNGKTKALAILPRPIQKDLPVWVTASGNPETFRQAGEIGANLLTNLLGQTVEELSQKIQLYHEAWKKAGHAGAGRVTVMVHTFVGPSLDLVREKVRRPFTEYLRTSVDLIQKASNAWSFAPFAARSRPGEKAEPVDLGQLSPEDMQAMLDFAFERYFETSGLFGTPESCLKQIERLKQAGTDEVACLIDFGVPVDDVLESLPYLNELREMVSQPTPGGYGFADQAARHQATHLQCTPSLMAAIVERPDIVMALQSLKKILLGGEAWPATLLERLQKEFSSEIYNMYGPTETTVWSTVARVDQKALSIGRPIANTQIYLLDHARRPVPPGVPGELFIGGAGVAPGYWKRPDLTAERFVKNPFRTGPEKMYRTGDWARYWPDGSIEYLGRMDQQVKIRGHRIELGECEAVLREHKAVREAVVVARESTPGEAQLIAYVVPHRNGNISHSPAAERTPEMDRVREWGNIWDSAYGPVRSVPEPDFNTAGWASSFNGKAMPEAEMREWVESTVTSIRQLQPRRILEIGCGTGLLLFRLAAQAEHYCAVDISAEALRHIRQNLAQQGIAESNVRLIQRAAHELQNLNGGFDCIILNSVIQYFPSLEYLRAVLRDAVRLLRPGGQIFIGDVRSLPLLEVFHTAVQEARHLDALSCGKARERIDESARAERELLVDPHFFELLTDQLPAVQQVRLLLKRGSTTSEMVRFRYDVILETRSSIGLPEIPPTVVHWEQDRLTVAQIDFQLTEVQPSLLEVQDIPNARLWAEARLWDQLQNADAAMTVAQLQRPSPGAAVDPEQLALLGQRTNYRVELRLASSGKADRFDLVFIHPRYGEGQPPQRLFKPRTEPARLANSPLQAALPDRIRTELKKLLHEKLPEFMVPSEIVFLESLPRTPNGKLDRQSLPAPDRTRLVGQFVPPEGAVEEVIAGIWSDLLGVAQVSRSDNFFELGGHSLLATQLISRLRETFRIDLPLRKLFEAPVVSRLAAAMESYEGSPGQLAKTATALRQGSSAPLPPKTPPTRRSSHAKALA